MINSAIDQVGNWNPQLLRELKGRLKPRNVWLALAVSIVAQVLPVLSYLNQLSAIGPTSFNRYCIGSTRQYPGSDPTCVVDALGNVAINWQLWFMDLFSLLSVISIFAFLLVGAYLLVSDLDREERRGTLNFIRLSPQTAPSILVGKLLGVPALLYLVAVTALPLHLWAGLSAQIPLLEIVTFYSVLLASCAFFYSAALLFGLRTTWLGGVQPWFFSGALFIFLVWLTSGYNFNGSAGWLQLFYPGVTLPYLVPEQWSESGFISYGLRMIQHLHFFYLPVGDRLSSLGGLVLLNYGLWGYWIWQALKRCFHSPSATLISKRQSYGLVVCWTVIIMGCALIPNSTIAGTEKTEIARAWMAWLWANFQTILSLNFCLFLGLIAALSPHRQTLQDWARYRQQRAAAGKQRPHRSGRGSLFQDLVWGEDSPSLVAIAINLLITTTILTPWILTWANPITQRHAFAGLMVSSTMILIYAVLVQTLLMQRLPKRGIWAMASVIAAIVLPLMILGALGLTPEKSPLPWLFSVAPWVAIPYVVRSLVLLTVLAQFAIFTGLTISLNRQIKQAGESESKRLLKTA